MTDDRQTHELLEQLGPACRAALNEALARYVAKHGGRHRVPNTPYHRAQAACRLAVAAAEEAVEAALQVGPWSASPSQCAAISTHLGAIAEPARRATALSSQLRAALTLDEIMGDRWRHPYPPPGGQRVPARGGTPTESWYRIEKVRAAHLISNW